MGVLKIAAVVLIIFAGLVGAYIIIRTPDLSAVSNTGAEAKEQDASVQGFISEKLGSLQNLFTETKNSITGNADNSENLTEGIANLIFNKLKSSDQQGENPFENLDFDSLTDAEIQNLMGDAVKSVQNPMLLSTTTIDNSQLKISLNNSKEAKAIYLEKVKKLNQQYFSDSKYQRTSEELIDSINEDCFAENENSVNREVSNIYKNLASNYLNLEVPSDLVEIHKRMIIYFKKASLVYRDLGQCYQDPIRGYVALWALPQLVDEGQKIQVDLDNLFKAI